MRGFTEAVQHISETDVIQPIATEPYTGGDLASLTNTFNQMLRRLATSRDQQNRLINDAGHELRTPLTSMRTNIDLLALDASNHLLGDADRALILGDVQTQMAGLASVITGLLQLTRDKTALQHEVVDLSALIETAADHAHRHGPGLTFDVELHALQMIGDEATLQRAFTNLLENAVTGSPPGGTIHVHLDGHQLRITDEGTGIADVDLPHIFDRFYRAEAARCTPGTGLGLAIAAKAIHDHGGTIEAGRSPQGGAEFTVQLPRASTPQLRALAPSSAGPLDARTASPAV